MRTKLMSTAAAFTSLLLTPTVVLGMGGYGGGSMGGPRMMHNASFDEYSTALRLIHDEKYADAIPHLVSALQDKPHNADILNYLGYTERMVGNYQISLDAYQRALHEDPDHKGAHEYLGELYLDMRDLPSANAQLAELVRLCPDSCIERDTLTKAIAAYQASGTLPNQPATAQAVPSAQPATAQQ